MVETLGNNILSRVSTPISPDWKLAGKGMGASIVPPPPFVYSGIIFKANSPQEAGQIPEGAILLVKETDPDYVFAMSKSGAIVTAIGGAASHAAITARELKKPAIVGATGIFDKLNTGDRIVMNVIKGEVYKV